MGARMLVKIVHYRCGEAQGSTYLLAPEGATLDNVQRDADAAQSEHLASVAKVKELQSYPSAHALRGLNGHPDACTIGEAKGRLAAAEAADKERERVAQAARGSFGDRMTRKGYTRLDEAATTATVDWGHRHGVQFNPSFTEVDYTPEPEADEPEADEEE